MPDRDSQLKAEWDRFIMLGIIRGIYPHHPKNEAGAFAFMGLLSEGVECVYDDESCDQVTADWRHLMLVCRLLSDIQAHCSDLAHAREILRLARMTLHWLYQPGVQREGNYERLKLVR